MKSKGLIFISCLAAGALIASPSLAKPAKKSAGKSMSKTTRMAAHTTQVMPGYRYKQDRQNISYRAGNTGYYAGTRYTGTRSYAGQQYSGTRYYGGTPYYYGRNNYYGGTQYYNGGYSYGSYPVWPYVAASVALNELVKTADMAIRRFVLVQKGELLLFELFKEVVPRNLL